MKTWPIAALLLVGACHHHHGTPPADLAPPPDMAAAYPRTMVTGTLQPTSPQNLLLNPLSGGDGSPLSGEFAAVYDDEGLENLTRTFQSVSPVGGSASVEELRGLHPTSSESAIYVLDDFLGGAGKFTAKIWLSLGDAKAQPIPFAQGASSVSVVLVDDDRMSQAVTLAPATTGPVKYGAREWMLFTSTGSVPIPKGGWLEVELTNLELTMQLAAPEVTSTALGGTGLSSFAVYTPLTSSMRAAISTAKRLHHDNRKYRPHALPHAR
jgi:hypothetical protein